METSPHPDQPRLEDPIPAHILLRPPSARKFGTLRTIGALILREMATRYGRSPGGYLWAILEPIGAISVLALAFSLVMRHPSLGTSFILFYATGYLPYSLYQSISSSVARALTFSRALLNLPAVTWVDAILARVILNALTGILVAYILLTAILLLNRTTAVIEIGPIIEAISLAVLLGFGIGSMNCMIIGIFPLWSSVWAIVTRPLFLASGIFLLYEDLPRTAQAILWYNPLLHITGLMREGFYPMYAPQYISPAFVVGLSLVLLASSFVLLRRFHREILNDD